MTTLLDKYINPSLTTAPFVMKDWNLNAPMPISALGQAITPTELPKATNLAPQFQGALTGAVASAQTPSTQFMTPSGAVVGANGEIITPAPVQKATNTAGTPQEQPKTLSDRFKALLGMEPVAPTSTVDTFTKLQEEQGIQGQQKEVNDLQAQLNAITAESQITPFKIEEGSSVRATRAGIAPLEASALRKLAIRALPVSAALNAAQGRLQSAQDNIKTILDLTQRDQENQYQYQKDQIDYAMRFADAEQKSQLEERKAQLDAEKSNIDQFNKTAQTYINAAISAGDYKTAAKLATAQDYNELSQLAGGISKPASAGENLNEVLSVTEAKALGVPYGTTKAQAIAKGVTPGVAGGGTLQLATAQNNIQNIDALKTSKGMAGTTGVYGVARWTPFTIDKAAKQDFIAGVEQMRSQLNLDTLINAKAQGATFGALSDQELQVLASAATKIGTWVIKDKNGIVTGYQTSESNMKKELDKISNFAKLDYILKGGSPESVGAVTMPNGKYAVANSDGTFTELN